MSEGRRSVIAACYIVHACALSSTRARVRAHRTADWCKAKNKRLEEGMLSYRLLYMLHNNAAIILLLIACTISFSSAARGAACPAPVSLGAEPSRLIVVVPGSGQGPAE